MDKRDLKILYIVPSIKTTSVMSKFSELKINTKMLIVIPMLNLLFMHYFFYFRGLLEWTWMYSEVINLCGVVFDVSVLTIIFLFIFGGRLKIAIAITQILTLLWSFVNVMYGKFFFQYMTLSAIGEAHGLGDGLVVNSIMSAFYWYDVYYLFSIIIFLAAYIRTEPYRMQIKQMLRLLYIPIGSIILVFVAYSSYHFVHPHYRNNWDLYKFRAQEFLYDSVRGGTPNLAHFQTGCVRVILFELYDMLNDMELTEQQRKQIVNYYSDHSLRSTNHERNPKIKNVIFILLESFLSAPIDLIVDGKEITPFLNSLKQDSDVYYNGKMISDIGCGESGDGQFIYMTGLLPLKYKMTVGQVKDNVLPSLPKVLKEQFGIKTTEIIFPTMPNLWQQAEMNTAYGIDHAYSLNDIVRNDAKHIEDKDIFDFASESLDKSKSPFFSLILSVSTHSPYNKYVGDNLKLTEQSLSSEYKNYLYSCHYLDKQLEQYIYVLKQKQLYDNSLIVIASDHYAHLDMLRMKGRISNYTPLFIIHGGMENIKSWKGEFHQIDTYTTLLDIMGICQPWLGLGYSILSSYYKNSVNSTAEDISRMIIEGNFFAQ